MAHVALGVVSPEPRVGIPVDRAVVGDVVGGVAISRLPFPTLLFLGRLLGGFEARKHAKGRDERQRIANALHKQPQILSLRSTSFREGRKPAQVCVRRPTWFTSAITAARTPSVCRQGPCSRGDLRTRQPRQDPR